MSTNPPPGGQDASGPPEGPAPDASAPPPEDAVSVPPAAMTGSPASSVPSAAPPAPPVVPPPPSGGGSSAGGDGWPPAAHPVTVTFDESETQNRLWGIPLLGILGRSILVIPHAIVLGLLAIAVGFIVFFIWVPILLVGKVPDSIRDFLGGYYRWYNRVWAYVALLTGRYPPFSLSGEHPVQTLFGPNPPISRWWGIPFISPFVRWLILIPHFIALWILGIAVGFAFLVSWFPVLVDGRMATWGFQLFGGWLRWTTRVTAYGMFVSNTYPPFTIGN